MLAEVKRVIVVKSLGDFLQRKSFEPEFKEAVKKWKKNLEKETGLSWREIEEDLYYYTEGDFIEFSEILKNSEGKWLIHYNGEADEFHLIEIV